MSGLKVNFSGMSANGRNTVQLSNDYAGLLAQLKANIENLMKIWRGAAANEFNSAYEQQDVIFHKFAELLTELGEKITEAARNFQNTEEENAAMAKNMFKEG